MPQYLLELTTMTVTTIGDEDHAQKAFGKAYTSRQGVGAGTGNQTSHVSIQIRVA
jgi:hypothetical protein